MSFLSADDQDSPAWRRGPGAHLPEVGDTGHEWVVVGGGNLGGIVVRRGRDLQSPMLNTKLGTGAVVEEMELVPGATCRLHYRKVSGDGPDFGWVSIFAGGKELLKLVDSRKRKGLVAQQESVDFTQLRVPTAPTARRATPALTSPGQPNPGPAATATETASGGAVQQQSAGGVTAAPGAPSEAEPWEFRERHLHEWTRGAFHPRRTVGEGRPLPPEGWEEPRSGGPYGPRGKMGRVSVVTPTTEGRQCFHETLWTCFEAQVWPDKELVVVETYEHRPSPFFVNLAKKDQRLVYLKFKVKPSQDWSIGLKRNVCSHMASGQFLAHFDDDDLYAPTYLSTMVREIERNDSAVAVTLSSWYIFQTQSGAFRHCDPITWGSIQDPSRGINDPKVRQQAFGYGFSYVYRRSAALENPYTNRNMGEDYAFFSELLAKSSDHVILHEDKYGICLHTQHGRNTSNSFALWEVPRESVHDLEIADFYPVFDKFLNAFPRKEADADSDDGCIKRTPARRSREVVVHAPAGDLRIRCAATVTAAEFRESLEDQLGALPSAVRLFRIPTSGWAGDGERRSWASKVLKVLWPSAPPMDDFWDPDAELCSERMYLIRRVRNAIPAFDRVGARTEELWLSLPGQRGPPGLGDEHADLRGLAPVHITCGSKPASGSVSSFLHVDLPQGARVAELRRALRGALPSGAEVLAPMPGRGCVALNDNDLVPCRVTVSEFPVMISYEMVMTKAQTFELQDLIKEAVVRPEFQHRLDEFEQQASRDSGQYRAGLAGLLMTEVYPDIQQHFGLEEGLKGQEAMFGALAQQGDLRITIMAYELEVLMRNTKRAAYYKWVLEQRESNEQSAESTQHGYMVTGASRHWR